MSWKNLETDEFNWLPGISDYGIGGVVCVAGKNPDDDKICSFCMTVEGGEGCPNLVPVAMIAAKPEEVIGKPRYRQNLEAIRCRLGI